MPNLPTSKKFNLCDYGLVKVSGPDAVKLLQGQLSCDITKITSDLGSMGVHCNPQGRVIYLFYAFKSNHGSYYLAMPASMTEIAINTLKKYALFYKVEVNNITGDYTLIGCSKELLPASVNGCVELPVDPGRYIYLTTTPGKTDDSETWKLLNIHDGIPAIYPETSGRYLPHELNLPALNAIDFDKGCYTGQEIIARMHYRAKLKTHMQLATAEQHFAPGAEITDSTNRKTIASIVDCSSAMNNGKFAALITINDNDITSDILTQNGITIET